MRKSFFRFLKLALVIFAGLCAWNYRLITYGLGQLTGQLHIIRNAVAVTEALRDPNLKPDYREKLLLIGKVRRFAMDSLGLHKSDNYTTFYDQHDKPVLWVVTGSLPYALQPREWWFPVVGTVSYMGFFDEHKAIDMESHIRKEGYETDIYSPSAWSTLGYFTDPVLSGQLNRGTGRLAELIIHELTHATVYLKDRVEFNENLATFIGERGTVVFLKSTFGDSAVETRRYEDFLVDDALYNEAMMQGAKSLDSLYQAMPTGLPSGQMALMKYRLIAGILEGINKLPFSKPERYIFRFKKDPLPNNTTFLSFLRYRKNQSDLERELNVVYHGDLRAFIQAYATISR